MNDPEQYRSRHAGTGIVDCASTFDDAVSFGWYGNGTSDGRLNRPPVVRYSSMRRRAFLTILAVGAVAGCAGSTDESAEGGNGVREDEATSTPISTTAPIAASTSSVITTTAPTPSPSPTTKAATQTTTCTMTGGQMYGYIEADSSDVAQGPVRYANLSAANRRLFDRLRERFVKGEDLSVSIESAPDVVVENGTYYRLEVGYWDRFC